jgi:hypothetical protein
MHRAQIERTAGPPRGEPGFCRALCRLGWCVLLESNQRPPPCQSEPRVRSRLYQTQRHRLPAVSVTGGSLSENRQIAVAFCSAFRNRWNWQSCSDSLGLPPFVSSRHGPVGQVLRCRDGSPSVGPNKQLREPLRQSHRGGLSLKSTLAGEPTSAPIPAPSRPKAKPPRAPPRSAAPV